MENKKLMFGEARFVFYKAGGLESRAALGGDETQSRRERAAYGKERGRREAVERAKKQRDILRGKVLTAGFDFKGRTFEVSFGQKTVKSMIDDLGPRIEKILDEGQNKAQLASLISLCEVPKGDEKVFRAVTARVYASRLLDLAKTGLDKEFPAFSKFAKEAKIKDSTINVVISQNASGNPEFQFSTKDPKVLEGYREWAKKNVKTVEASKKAVKKTAKKNVEKVAKSPDLDRFAKSPLGRLFGFLKDEKGKTWLQLMAENKAPFIAMFIAGLFGYKIGADAYGGVVDMMPAKYKKKIDDLQKKARSSRLSAEKFAARMRGKGKEALKAGKVEGVDRKFFDIAVRDNDMPSGGMRLDVDYNLLPGERLDADLSGGGKVALPKGVKANVNGALSNAGESYSSGKVSFRHLIPRGTIFTGKISFTKVAPKKKV